jgi:uncharacterized protein involved in exopolysaccharide biosynthesis
MFSSDMTAALKMRWKQILAILIATIAVAVLWLSVSPRSYTARASLLFDDRGPNPSVEENAAPSDNRSLLGTQADIIKSDVVARRVIQNANLASDPTLLAQWNAAKHGKQSLASWLVDELLSHVDVVPERDTNVLAVRYTAPDPTLAARIANAFAANFVAARRQISTDAAKQYAAWFQERTTEVRSKLERAQMALTQFQSAHGMVSGNSLALEADRLSSLSTQLADAESGAADLRARAGTSVSQSPDVQSSLVVGSLRQQVALAEAKVAELSSTHGRNHPDMVAAQAELSKLRDKLGTETAAASQTVRVASSAASSRESQLQGLVGSQRAKMLEMTGYQSQLDILQNEVNTAQKAYDGVTQRLDLMRLQSGLPTTNAQQVDHATPPLLPTSPNVPIVMLLAALLGLALGIIAALVLEWRRPLIRTPEGMVRATGISVLGSFHFSALKPAHVLRLGGY